MDTMENTPAKTVNLGTIKNRAGRKIDLDKRAIADLRKEPVVDKLLTDIERMNEQQGTTTRQNQANAGIL